MASSITTTGFDENFPVAGQDNDSQGFRDNFSIIKSNFNYAKTEIDALQAGVARVDQANDFDGNTISNAVLADNALLANTSLATGTTSAVGISFSEGYVHVIRCDNDNTITFSNWPTDEYGAVKLFITTDGAQTITFSAGAGTWKDDGYAYDSSTTNTRVISGLNASDPLIFEVFTYNAGSTLFIRYVGAFS